MYRAILNPVVPDVPRGGDLYPIEEHYADAKAERDLVAPFYDEAVRFALPGRRGILSGPNDSVIYDDTAVTATPEFASNIQAGIMPNFARWAMHLAGVLIEDPAERDEVTALLQQVDQFLFEMINSSSAPAEVHESLIDLSLGTGCLRIDQGHALHPLQVRAIPPRCFTFTVGADGQPDAVFEDRWLTPSMWDVDYPGIELPADVAIAGAGPKPGNPPPATGTVAGKNRLHGVEAWRRDWTEPAAYRWKQCVFFPDAAFHVGLEDMARGPGCVPYVGPFRWSKGSGEAWGRGPLFNCLPSMRTVNFAMSAVIDHADLALAGIWSIEDDGVVNVDTIRLEPGTVVPKAVGSKGLENLRPGQDFDIQRFMLEEMRKNIKRALYTDELGDPERSPKTATEIQHRMANLARRIGSPFGRLILELVLPFITRATRVLKNQGLIKLPTVDGREVALNPTSPLGQSQVFEDIDAFDRFTALIRDRFGPEALNLLVDAAESSDYLAELFRVPRRVLRVRDKQVELVDELVKGIAEGGGQAAGFGGEVIPPRFEQRAAG